MNMKVSGHLRTFFLPSYPKVNYLYKYIRKNGISSSDFVANFELVFNGTRIFQDIKEGLM